MAEQRWQYEWLRDEPRKARKGVKTGVTASAENGWEVVGITTTWAWPLPWTQTWVLMRRPISAS